MSVAKVVIILQLITILIKNLSRFIYYPMLTRLDMNLVMLPMNDWRLINQYYGLSRIVNECKQMRTLDPVCLSFICTISHTKEEEYRCYHFRQSFPTPWNS